MTDHAARARAHETTPTIGIVVMKTDELEAEFRAVEAEALERAADEIPTEYMADAAEVWLRSRAAEIRAMKT